MNTILGGAVLGRLEVGGWATCSWLLAASSCNFVFPLSSSVIVTEKTNILLRYLHQQWDKKVRHRGLRYWDSGNTVVPIMWALSGEKTWVAGRLGVRVGC